MKINYLKELRPYSFVELQSVFNKDEDETKEILKSLSLKNMVRKLSKDTSEVELEDLLGTENLEEINGLMDGNLYVFKYVGIVAIIDVCLIIYPKYINNFEEDKDNNFETIRQLISVIEKYKHKEQNVGLGSEFNKDNFNLLSLTLDLLSNYYEYGLYINDKQTIEQNGDGESLWEKTINESVAYISDDTPVYLDVFTQNQESNTQDYFTMLHLCILSEACSRVKDILNILGVTPVSLSQHQLDYFGSKEFITYRLNQELSSQFITYKQKILKLLRNYVQEDFSKKVSDKMSFIGTNSFNLVWENVCSVVFNNSKDKSLRELGLDYSSSKRDSVILSKIIPKPKWMHADSKKCHYASKTLKPDIVKVSGKNISIYDAKYYQITLNEVKVRNQPGVGDVTKQYLYELAYMKFAEEKGLKFMRNAFLMPDNGDKALNIGTASFDIFEIDGIKFNEIEIYLLPHKKMYEYYLNDDHVEDISEFFKWNVVSSPLTYSLQNGII